MANLRVVDQWLSWESSAEADELPKTQPALDVVPWAKVVVWRNCAARGSTRACHAEPVSAMDRKEKSPRLELPRPPVPRRPPPPPGESHDRSARLCTDPSRGQGTRQTTLAGYQHRVGLGAGFARAAGDRQFTGRHVWGSVSRGSSGPDRNLSATSPWRSRNISVWFRKGPRRDEESPQLPPRPDGTSRRLRTIVSNAARVPSAQAADDAARVGRRGQSVFHRRTRG
jgi:hypothetical protein